jgi:hypothetical protein
VVSVVIRPHVSVHVVNAALQCVPAEVLPRADDTVESLVARLAASPFLDDAHVLNGGNGKRGAHGKKRRRLNATHYPAPRRKTWSVVVHPARTDEDGEGSVHGQGVRPDCKQRFSSFLEPTAGAL